MYEPTCAKSKVYIFDVLWHLKMADDGAVSDGSDIDIEDSNVGSSTDSISGSLLADSDERQAVGEQWVRNLFAEDDLDFGGSRVPGRQTTLTSV